MMATKPNPTTLAERMAPPLRDMAGAAERIDARVDQLLVAIEDWCDARNAVVRMSPTKPALAAADAMGRELVRIICDRLAQSNLAFPSSRPLDAPSVEAPRTAAEAVEKGLPARPSESDFGSGA